jgi:MIP family channel proteins
LVLFGTGAVAAATITGAQSGLWQVAVVWGFGITVAIYATGAISGAHLNPAVSLTFAIFRRDEFPIQNLLPYWCAQLIGGILGGLTILMTFGPFIKYFEESKGIVRGEPGSELSAMVFGEYFPNPAVFGTSVDAKELISPIGALGIEAFGTGILVFVILALVDRRNSSISVKSLAPFFIGFTIAVLISIFAPLTQGGWNPARDLGPRIVAFFAGWGLIAIPGPSAGFWIYIVGPLIGGPLGGLLYETLIRKHLPLEKS